MVLIMNFILIQMVIKDQIKAAKIHSMFGLIIMDKLFHMEELNTQNIKILTIFYGQTAVLLIGLKNLLILNLVPVLLLITDTKYSMHTILYKKKNRLSRFFFFIYLPSGAPILCTLIKFVLPVISFGIEPMIIILSSFLRLVFSNKNASIFSSILCPRTSSHSL